MRAPPRTIPTPAAYWNTRTTHAHRSFAAGRSRRGCSRETMPAWRPGAGDNRYGGPPGAGRGFWGPPSSLQRIGRSSIACAARRGAAGTAGESTRRQNADAQGAVVSPALVGRAGPGAGGLQLVIPDGRPP